jgi:hypothetical protein
MNKNGRIKKSFRRNLNSFGIHMLPVTYARPLPEVYRISPHIQPLQLRETQIAHYHRTTEILNSFNFYVDGSEMGTGKTYIAAAHAITRQLPVIVLCPKIARQAWLEVCAIYGISLWDLLETGGVITYDTMRSVKGHQPRHGLLERDDSTKPPTFRATPLLTEIIRSGVLVIFDECQKLKNDGDQYHAAKVVMRQLYTVGGRSRAAFLSGTSMNKPEHAKNFLKFVGFIQQRNLYSKIQGQVRLEGVDELHSWARLINPKGLESFMLSHPFRSTSVGSKDYVFQLYAEVIRPGVMSIMPSLKLDKDVKNGYYRLEPEDEMKYTKGISSLASVAYYNESTGTIVRTKENMGAITTALMTIQDAKKKAMARKAREDLMANPNCKVVLFADYYKPIEDESISTIDYLLQALADFHPLELTGRVNENRRSENVSRFQEQNANYRVIVGNPKVGGLSINLHDITGNFPRIMYIMPGYSINELHQATGRISRDGLIGKAIIRFFYGFSGAPENGILSAFARGGEVMEKIHAEQGTRFPNQYENEYELADNQSPDNVVVKDI